MILSMTIEERLNPSVIDGSRRRRIAKGSGARVRDVNQLLKQFKEMKKMMKSMSKLMGKGRKMDIQQMLNNMDVGKMGGGPKPPF
ncbi:MAG: signal recognition particle protein, partial [Bacteroidetes bacterium]|jgi:signal recognition particle subunit SRP54|nr:signal recognition particle protein [Bacteroidota bacterium]